MIYIELRNTRGPASQNLDSTKIAALSNCKYPIMENQTVTNPIIMELGNIVHQTSIPCLVFRINVLLASWYRSSGPLERF